MKHYTNRLIFPGMLLILVPVFTYFIGGFLIQFYIDSGARKLVKLDREGRLSREYGYAWEQINAGRALEQSAAAITDGKNTPADTISSKHDHVVPFPSLAAVAALNKLNHFDKTIRIYDRNRIPLAVVKTTHTSVTLAQLNDILLESLLTTEDRHFYKRKKGYDLHALLRAVSYAVFQSLRHVRLQAPRGSSTIQMQVARFLLLKSTMHGYAYTEKSLSRKIKELKCAQALSMMYTRDELLTLYVNHCVSAGRGMTGYHDISTGLFGVTPDKLTVAQSLYLARLVKWNRQVPNKIVNQIKASLPNLAQHFKWSDGEQRHLCLQLDSLTFSRPAPLIPEKSGLIDCANEYLRTVCQQNGMANADLAEMDISNPESMLRRYGNVEITMTIDYRLQKWLERTVASRGFGPDTTIRTDIRIGSLSSTIAGKKVPPDTVRSLYILSRDSIFRDPSTHGVIPLKKGDTIVSTIRYRHAGADSIRRFRYFYKRDTLSVPGQYYAYALMDSRTHQLLAWCSKDRLGSRLRSLLVNKNPNGSCVAKPLVYALAYDMDLYGPSDMASDNSEFDDSCAWARKYLYRGKQPIGMIYSNVREKDGYAVRNYDRAFSGHDFLFNHLAHSNNIVAVETMYRLSTDCSSSDIGRCQYIKKYLQRLGGDTGTVLHRITGPELYCAMVAAIRDTTINDARLAENYSITLGTLELSLYEQMHLFNALYDNRIVVAPSRHPSLFIKNIRLSGETLPIIDSVETRTPFDDYKKLAPVHLALHKRLISNPEDRLVKYDICPGSIDYSSNFAKSGTTDNIIRPFDADAADTARTCYGLWNAVMRLRLKRDDLRKSVSLDTAIGNHTGARFSFDSVPAEELLDVTLACIGECNFRHTGEPDGKTLHGYVSRGLLHTFGIPCISGYYQSYEKGLLETITDDVKYENEEKPDLPFLSHALIILQTGLGTKENVDKVQFEKSATGKEIRLKGKNYRKMLSFASYLGSDARRYRDLVKRLKRPNSIVEARNIISQILSLRIDNQVLKHDIDRACASLLQSCDTPIGKQE